MIDLTSDLQVLAATCAGEARGDVTPDEEGVACVVMNRVKIAKTYVVNHGHAHPLYGNGTVANCCFMRMQFDAWNQGDPNRAWIWAQEWDGSSSDQSVAKALSIASQALAGALPDVTNGATSYKATSLPWPHAWGPEIAPVAVLGKQSFYILT